LALGLVFSLHSFTLDSEVYEYSWKELSPLKNIKVLSLMVLSLLMGFTSVAQASQVNCYLGACVGDRAVNVSRDYREVSIVSIDNFGKFILRFADNGGVGGNWDRHDLALMAGCQADLCVGFPALNIDRNYRAVTVHALHYNSGKFVLRFADNGGVGGNWDRSDLAVAWGCVGGFCVNDTVHNRTNNRQAMIAAVQTNMSGLSDRFVLNYSGALGGNWEASDLILISRGPPAYPPSTIPYCPPGTHYDSRTNSCVQDMPPPPVCPPGTHYDPRLGRCVSSTPPPPPHRDWSCSINKQGRVFMGRGPTRGAALTGAMNQCARAGGGYVCRASDAVCSQ